MVSENRAALKKRMERLNFLWGEFHNELLELNPPTSATVEFNHDERGGCDVIGFGKVRGQWAIFTGVQCYNQETNDIELSGVKAIDECSAETRVGMVVFVPQLRAAVEGTFEQFLKRADDAIEKLESQLDLSGTMGSKQANKR